MNILAVNTLEVRVTHETGDLQAQLSDYARAFEQVEGCLGFVVSQSHVEQGLWLLSGFWASEPQMSAHFVSDEMTAMINTLIESQANLTFASFNPMLAEN